MFLEVFKRVSKSLFQESAWRAKVSSLLHARSKFKGFVPFVSGALCWPKTWLETKAEECLPGILADSRNTST